MNEQEKSIKILKIIGWHPVIMPKYHSEGWYRLADENGKWLPIDQAYKNPEDVWRSAPNLYRLDNIYLAWNVMNWARRQPDYYLPFLGYWDGAGLWEKPLEIAQPEWLDKILEIAEGVSQDTPAE